MEGGDRRQNPNRAECREELMQIGSELGRTTIVLAILGLFQAGVPPEASAQTYPIAPHHHHRALPGRRPERHAHPRSGRTDESRARSVHHHRERHRRRRQHRCRPRRSLGAGRLHARHRPQPNPRHQRRIDEFALRRGEGFRAGVADRRHAAMADQPQDPAGQQPQGADRLAQGQQGDLGFGRCRRTDRSVGARFSRRRPARSSSSCPIAAARRCCRT